MTLDLDSPCSQADFAAAVGITRQAVGVLVRENVMTPGQTAREWLHAYCRRLREQAAGRANTAGRLVLADERARLAKEQRIGQEMKNAELRGELIRVDAVRAAWAKTLSELRDHLLAQPARLAPVVAGSTRIEDCYRLLEDDVIGMLTIISSRDADKPKAEG